MNKEKIMMKGMSVKKTIMLIKTKKIKANKEVTVVKGVSVNRILIKLKKAMFAIKEKAV